MRLTPVQVLAPWAVGLFASGYLVSCWGGIRTGFFRLVAFTSAAIAALATYSLASRIPDRPSLLATLALGAFLLGALATAISRLGEGGRSRPTRIFEAGSLVFGGLTCIAVGGLLSEPALGMARAFAAALFLGSVTATMMLGHWFLVDPKMPREAIRRLAKLFIAATVVEVVALLIPPGMVGAYARPRLGIGGYLPPFWVVLVVTTFVFGCLVLASLRERGYPAVMAATGLSYLTILSAFGVDVIGKALISG